MRKFVVYVGCLLLIMFAALSKYEDRAYLRNLDFAVTVKVQEKIDGSAHLRLASLVGNLMEGATYFANPVTTSVAVLLITGAFIYDRKKKRFRWRAAVIPLGFVLILVAELYGKSIVHHPSPPYGMIKHPTSVFPASYVNEQFSYPSGHAARAVYIAISLWFLGVAGRLKTSHAKKYLTAAVLVLYAVLVSVSRIYLGEHWFSDVLGGLLLGSGIGCIVMPFAMTYTRSNTSS